MIALTVRKVTLTLGAAAVLGLPAGAAAHIERPSYWPDPAADTSITPAAGGQVPVIRTLASALNRKAVGDTRVVCQPNSMSLVRRSIATARSRGYEIRPSDHRVMGRKAARAMLRTNQRLRKMCKYREIQPAVMASGNNDRVVIMPGLYTEPTARSQPTLDPACDKYETKTEFGDPGALSYAYQFHCPNDQNLIAVLGRGLGTGTEPDPPPSNRHGIPNLGPCIRCNLQIEGSGASPDDVIIDAGRVESGNGGPHGAKKDVAVRADRADGFVLRNVTVRHAKEHGIYVLESDGYVLDRWKAFYNGLYGTLTFVEDHGVQSNCEAVGHGDSGIYPGAAAETGAQRKPGTEARLNQEIFNCDLHHNLAGLSGTDGNAIHFHDNNVYDNALGITTDVVTAAGHPGYPGDSALFEKNNLFSNNFNPYKAESDVRASFPFPVGTAMWIAGGNNHTVRNNRIFDNWRRGTMVYAVPDALICGPDSGNDQEGCDMFSVSVSNYNTHTGNIMGMSPDNKVLPNGTDFWWDAFPGNTGNCWYGNTGPHPITSSPAGLPSCSDGKNPQSSVGTGNLLNQAELFGCLVNYATDSTDSTTCPWFVTPPKPGTRKAARASALSTTAAQRVVDSFCANSGPAATCGPLSGMLSPASRDAMDRRLADLRLASPRSLSAWGLIGPASTTSRVPLSQFKCVHWRAAGAATRLGVVRRLTAFNGGRVAGTGGWGSVLTTEHANHLFDARCQGRASSGFLLYKLYGYTAGLLGVAPPSILMR